MGNCAPGGFNRQNAKIFEERYNMARMYLKCLVWLFAVRAWFAVELVQPTVGKHPLPAFLKLVDPASVRITEFYFFFMDGCFGEQSAQNMRQILVQLFRKNLWLHPANRLRPILP